MSQGLAMLGGGCANSLAAEDRSLMGPPGKRGTSFLCEESAPSPNIQTETMRVPLSLSRK